jgi:hypothetical protein
MRYLFLSLFALIIITISCTKNNSVSIAGNWNLISDSTYSGIGIVSSIRNYKGLNSDYFYFNTNGLLYIKEDTLYDTLNYHIVDNNKIIIDSISLSENGEYTPSDITTLTEHAASIQVTGIPNPGGTYARCINLSR